MFVWKEIKKILMMNDKIEVSLQAEQDLKHWMKVKLICLQQRTRIKNQREKNNQNRSS